MKQSLFSIGLSLLLLLLGCSDDPNSVGYGLLPIQDSLSLRSFTVMPDSSSNYTYRLAGTASQQLFGKAEGIECRALMQFSGLPTSLSSYDLDTAFLRFPISYRFLDSNGNFNIRFRTLLRAWTDDSLRWDSTDNASLVSGVTSATFQMSPISETDTLLEIPIDDIVRSWMEDTLASPYGFMIEPDFGCDVVIGCPSSYGYYTDDRPQLYIVYRDSDGDTIRLSYRPFQQVFFANGTLPAGDTLFYLQEGIAYRNKLNFDLSRIPKYASITKASLTLTLDSAHTLRNDYAYNTVVALLALDNAMPPALSTISSSSTFASDTTYTITLDLRTLIQQSLRNNYNYGFVLRSNGDYVGINRYAFYSQSASDPAKRPQLTVTYTVLP